MPSIPMLSGANKFFALAVLSLRRRGGFCLPNKPSSTQQTACAVSISGPKPPQLPHEPHMAAEYAARLYKQRKNRYNMDVYGKN